MQSNCINFGRSCGDNLGMEGTESGVDANTFCLNQRPLIIPDVNANRKFHGNALSAASYRGREKAVRLLLEIGANVNAKVT